MYVASLLLLSAKALFLLQYYALMAFLIVKNVFKRIFCSSDEGSDIFAHPKRSVHPDVFAQTCKITFNPSDEFIKH